MSLYRIQVRQFKVWGRKEDYNKRKINGIVKVTLRTHTNKAYKIFIHKAKVLEELKSCAKKSNYIFR